MQKVLQEAKPRLFVIEVEGKTAAVVRFDLPAPREVSINLHPKMRGLGLSKAILVAGCRAFFANDPPVPLAAVIALDNHRSLGLFTKLGFRPTAMLDERFCRYERDAMALTEQRK